MMNKHSWLQSSCVLGLCFSVVACSNAKQLDAEKQQESVKNASEAEPARVTVKEVKIATPEETLAELKEAETTFKMQKDLLLRVNRVALGYGADGRYRDAEQLLGRVVSLCKLPQVNDRLNLATSLNNLGLLFMKQKKYGRAEPLMQSALVLEQDVLGAADPRFAGSICNLGSLYYEQARYKDALPLFDRALAIYKTHADKNQEAIAKTLNNVAGCYSNLGKHADAEKVFAESLEMEEKMPVVNNGSLAAALNNLGYIYVIEGKFDKAEPLLQRGLTLAESTYGDKSLELVSFLDNNAYLLRKTKRAADAEKLKHRAKQILLANNM